MPYWLNGLAYLPVSFLLLRFALSCCTVYPYCFPCVPSAVSNPCGLDQVTCRLRAAARASRSAIQFHFCNQLLQIKSCSVTDTHRPLFPMALCFAGQTVCSLRAVTWNVALGPGSPSSHLLCAPPPSIALPLEHHCPPLSAASLHLGQSQESAHCLPPLQVNHCPLVP